jgi:hypothetical protein
VEALTRRPINHDVAALADLAWRTLQGERLYLDIWEPNPPLAVWMLMPPVLARDLLGLSLPSLLQGWLLALSLVPVALLARLLHRVPSLESAVRSAVVLSFGVLATGALHPYQLGNRDPLAMACALPYVLAAELHARELPIGRRLAVATGIVAALGLCLKPTLLGVVFATELVLLVAQRRPRALLRVEALAFAAIVASYAAYVAFFSGYARMLRELFPLYNRAYAARIDDLWGASQPWVANLAGWLVVAIAIARGPRVAALYAGALGASVASALVQAKGWTYHWMPMHVVAGSGAIALVASLPRRASSANMAYAGRLRVLALGLASIVVVALRMHAMHVRPAIEDGARVIRWVDSYAEGGRVLALTSSCGPVFPALAHTTAHLTGSSGTMLLPGLYAEAPPHPEPFPYRTLDAMPPLERGYLDSVERAFERDDPRLVLVHTVTYKQGFGPTSFDFLEHLRADPRLVARLTAYREVERTERWRVLVKQP